MKKLPTNSVEVTLADILIALFRVKGDNLYQDPASPYHTILKILVHTFCQRAEQMLEGSLMDQCPDPQVNARVHPFRKESRLRGNKSLQMNLVSRFAARGSGYVSTKDSSLASLDVVHEKSSIGSRTSSEFSCRILMKTASHMQEVMSVSKNINFCFDAAMVSEEHVTW